jgi:putative heme-binding domain-containing protein
MPATKDAKPLPPLAELVERRGNAGNGQLMFAKATCNTCHLVNGEGADFGPDLSQIGDKLSRDAMYVSILDPSAGIAHSYEGVRIQTDEGIDIIGIITSEGDDELTIKMPKGVTQSLKPSQVIDRQKLTTSVMPAGLTAALTAQELIDLVEYMTTLKKAQAEK